MLRNVMEFNKYMKSLNKDVSYILLPFISIKSHILEGMYMV